MGVAALISLEGIHHSYRVQRRPWSAPQVTVGLDGVDLQLHADEVLAVVGDSGSGKSTLARVAAGLLRPDRGRALYEGQDSAGFDEARWKQHRRFVQLVFQEAAAALDPLMRVRDIIEQPLRVQGMPASGAAERLAKEVQLELSALERFAHQLSGGQKRRVGLARALGLCPKVMVLDEPLASLDASGAAHILQLLSRVRESQGLAMLWVTHDLRAVQSFATRVAVLERGRVVEEGPVDRVLGAPRHAKTQDLLAAMPPVFARG